MSNNAKFKKLLEPLQIKQVKFRNRIIKPGQILNYAEKDGYVGQRNLDFYENLARGGVGMIITEDASVDFTLGSSGVGRICVDDDKFIPSLAELASVIHKHGCPAFNQIGHSGPGHHRKHSRLQPLAPSSLNEDELQRIYTSNKYDVCKELTIPEIEDIIEQFAKGAERVKKAGFDGVEVHAAHGYLLNSFISRVLNKRQDKYGCQTLENRARFAVEVLRAIRERVGPDFPVGIRINGAEYGLPECTTSEETAQIAPMLEAATADYIHVSAFSYGRNGYILVQSPEQLLYPESQGPLANLVNKPGVLVPLAAAIKKNVSIPVIAVGRLDPVLGEWILRNGMADAIALGRRLMADPELPNKVIEGRLEDIRPCTACLSCRDIFMKNEPVACRANASLGREREYEIKPANKKKKVVVVGGGPSGMEAARVAAARGHDVTLYDREPKLGGLLDLAALIKGLEIEDLPALAMYFKTQLAKLGVKTSLGEEFTPALIEETKPDVVIVATGGKPAAPKIPGMERRNVLTSEELHRRAKTPLRLLGPRAMGKLTKFWLPIGKKVVIIGGSMHGLETAEFLVKRGRKVTIVEPSDKLGASMGELHLTMLTDWLRKKGASMLAGASIEEITGKGLNITTKEGKKQTIAADTVVIAMPPEPNSRFLLELKGKVPEVYLSGDCREPHLILEAIADGARIGHAI
ncbi:MAG: FAD-dependent oxidoreductase [Chloroflexi bacterium]|nr:FAD-dependent oxidoreductase [Chloroflexota bacterium]